MKDWILFISTLLNLVLLGVLVFLNDRYGLWAKVQRVALEEGRVPGVAASYELNRNYQVRREMFRLDNNESARVLMLGDSLTAQGEWNAMLGKPLVANRGIDGDTSAGVLARIGDDADFRGDAVVVWIGTNDVLQGGAAGPVAERIMEAARGKAKILKAGRPAADSGGLFAESGGRVAPEIEETTKHTNLHEIGKIIGGKIIGTTEEETGLRLAGQAGASESDSLPSELADSPVSESHISSADGPASALDPGRSSLDTVPEAPKIFVLGIPPMARWWEGARERNAVIREINARLAEGAEKNGYRFVELQAALADENGFLRGELTSDGVHLSAKGYVAVIQRLKEAGLWPAAED